MKTASPSLRRSIQTAMKRLARIAAALDSEGLEDEAKSLETTIADLHWQCEELDQLQPMAATSSEPQGVRIARLVPTTVSDPSQSRSSSLRSGSAG